jgi:hypothetical protein
MKPVFKSSAIILIQIFLVLFLTGCKRYDKGQKGEGMRIIFLHHSTGELVWKGGVKQWFKKYNAEKGTNYKISEWAFPKASPYGWKNYPFDYWNIWVKNAGDKPFMKEPTLEILTKEYQVIIWKHCFPFSKIKKDIGAPDINSEEKRIENYKLHYSALKEKMREFPNTKFIVWTGAALVKNATDEESGKRAKEFFEWVKKEWDQPGDNIYLWDFYQLETEGNLYLKEEYAVSSNNSHPNIKFSQMVAPLFCQRIVEVIEGRGDVSSITGR